MSGHHADVSKANSGLDKLIWLTIIVLIVLAIFGNYYFSLPSHTILPLLRIGAVALLIIVAFVLACLTQKGKSFLTFARESRTEMRKVVWPTRKEALQTTFIVAIVTLIASLILWGLDSILVNIVYFITTLGH